MPALLTRSLGKGSLKAIRYIHRTPRRGASSGLYHPLKMCAEGLVFVNPGLLGFRAVASVTG